MKQHLNIGKEPNFQKIVIASAVLHILCIALAAVPLRTKEREYKSYFVNLVSQAEILRTSDIAPRVLPGRTQKAAKAEPEKTHQNEKTQVTAEKSGEKDILKKTYGNKENSSSALLWQIGNNATSSKKEFEIIRDYQKPKGEYHQEPVPADKGYIGTTFAAKEDSRKEQFVIARGSGTIRTETLPEDPKSGLYGNPDTGFKRNAQFGSSEQGGGSKIIEKPGLSGGSGEIVYNGQDVQTAKNAYSGRKYSGGEGISSGNNKLLTSEMPIKGVPLAELIACTNALDEGILKKKILNIIGNRKECYGPTTGKFVFLGTDRYTSFEMTIVPVSGRKLSNRCDELKNALLCLKSIKE